MPFFWQQKFVAEIETHHFAQYLFDEQLTQSRLLFLL